MDGLDGILRLLNENGADYEVLRYEKPIRSTQDASEFFDIRMAAPVFVLDTDNGIFALIKSAGSGKIPFAKLRQLLNCTRVSLASPEMVRQHSGYDIGAIPLVGLSLPVVFDNALLQFAYIYGGIGDVSHTLKIAPADVRRLNRVVAFLE